MIRRGQGKAILLVVLGLIILVPGFALADQASNKTIISVINNPTDVIIPPVNPNPPGNTTVITGSSAPSTTLKIIDNGRYVARTQTNPDGTFTVTVPLQDGRNEISIQKPDSQPSKPITVTRTPSWWQHWGKKLAYIIAAVVLILAILWFIFLQLFARRKKNLFGGDDDDDDKQN